MTNIIEQMGSQTLFNEVSKDRNSSLAIIMAKVFSEDELGRKWDRCFTDGILKFGGGAFLGAVFSLLFFKRRAWPVVMGMGFGIGMAYSNCEHELNSAIVSSGANMRSRPTAKEKC